MTGTKRPNLYKKINYYSKDEAEELIEDEDGYQEMIEKFWRVVAFKETTTAETDEGFTQFRYKSVSCQLSQLHSKVSIYQRKAPHVPIL